MKYGLDVQEEQLKLDPPMGLQDERFAVEPENLQGTLTVLDDTEKVVSKKVPTERGD